MIEGNLKELAEVLSGSEITNLSDSVSFSGLSIDTRTIKEDNLFIAIIGENTDGHKYLEDAEQAGASGYVIEKSCQENVSEDVKKKSLIVEDTKKALRDISLWWKAKFNPEFVAITGTNGKTTTKEMTADVLSKKYKVLRSPGNYNNLYGIPLSLCLLDDTHEICVFELGMSFPGEIKALTGMINPNFVLITNIGPAHLETMGSIENIARAKFELLENCPKQATRILNIDDPILAKRFESEPSPKISYAVNAKADIMPSGFSSNSYGRIISVSYTHLTLPTN